VKISNLKRIEMKNIDLSNNVRYSAILNGNKLIQYETDGIFHKHLTLQEWEEYIKKIIVKD
tara:strand:- start:270 stop:452 length:183 start_codon:yes stop_codon:yes gene_type:complete